MDKEKKQEIIERQDQSPNEMIHFAIEKGADLDKLEKLMMLKREWEKDEARKAYHQAMADFKASPPKINKDKKVGYKTDRGSVGYSHASLYNVTDKISSELSKHGLSASWTTKQNGQILVTCKITHVRGHSEETTLSAPSDTSGAKNAIQAIGSTITYLERYTLLALTGLATFDQDDDGVAVSQDKITEEQLSFIRDTLIELGIEKKPQGFLKYMGVEKAEDILKSDFPKAKAALESKKVKVSK